MIVDLYYNNKLGEFRGSYYFSTIIYINILNLAIERYRNPQKKTIILHNNIHFFSTVIYVRTKPNYRLSTSSRTTGILSYTVLEDDMSYEKLSSKLVEAEMQGLAI